MLEITPLRHLLFWKAGIMTKFRIWDENYKEVAYLKLVYDLNGNVSLAVVDKDGHTISFILTITDDTLKIYRKTMKEIGISLDHLPPHYDV